MNEQCIGRWPVYGVYSRIMNRYSYKNLNVYQDAKAFVVAVYKLVDEFPEKEKFALCNQIRRAAISVTSNIAEGVSRTSVKEKIHFLEIAYASMMEVDSQLDISVELQYINIEQYELINKQVNNIGRQLSVLRNKYKTLQCIGRWPVYGIGDAVYRPSACVSRHSRCVWCKGQEISKAITTAYKQHVKHAIHSTQCEYTAYKANTPKFE